MSEPTPKREAITDELLTFAVQLDREAVAMTVEVALAQSKERQRLHQSAMILRHAHRMELLAEAQLEALARQTAAIESVGEKIERAVRDAALPGPTAPRPAQCICGRHYGHTGACA